VSNINQGGLKMRKLKFVSVFVLLALLVSAGVGVAAAQEPPPKVETVDRGGNRADPNYVYTAEELEALAVKDRLAEKHVQELDGVKGGSKILTVGYWPQPNDWAHRNYCGPGATQVALDARLPYRGTTDYAYYTETAGSVAGYNGPYRQCVTKGNMWQYVDGNDAQVW